MFIKHLKESAQLCVVTILVNLPACSCNHPQLLALCIYTSSNVANSIHHSKYNHIYTSTAGTVRSRVCDPWCTQC